MCVYICACVITRFFHSHGSHLQRQWLVQGNDWGFKKFIRRGQCDDKLTLYCKVSSSHNSWPDVSSLLLCSSLCLYTHQTHALCMGLMCAHAHTHIHVHTQRHTNTCTHMSTLDTRKYKHTHSTLTQVSDVVNQSGISVILTSPRSLSSDLGFL